MGLSRLVADWLMFARFGNREGEVIWFCEEIAQHLRKGGLRIDFERYGYADECRVTCACGHVVSRVAVGQGPAFDAAAQSLWRVHEKRSQQTPADPLCASLWRAAMFM